MHTVDLIAFAPHMYTMEGEGVGYKADHALVVDGGKIVAVMKKEEALRAYQAEKVLALPHHVLLPGLIDAHMHTGSNILRGLAQDTGYWMMYGVQPFSLQQTIEDYEAGSKVAMIEAIKAGTTTLGDSKGYAGPLRISCQAGCTRNHYADHQGCGKARI